MIVHGSRISCGINEVCSVGNNPTQKQLDNVLRGLGCAILVAALEPEQRKAIKLFIKNGFKQIGKTSLFMYRTKARYRDNDYY